MQRKILVYNLRDVVDYIDISFVHRYRTKDVF